MKFRNSAFLLALALIVSSPLISHASTCSDSSLRGSYAFTIHGSIIPTDGSTLLVDGLAKQTFDGNGNFTQVDAVAVGGNLPPGWRPGSGTYSLNPDCTGSQTIVIPGNSDVHLQLIVAQSGNTIHQVVIDPGVAATAEGERVRAPKHSD
jgi:hypothetical protein